MTEEKNILVNVTENSDALVPTTDVDGTPLNLKTKDGTPLVPMVQTLQNTIDSLPYDAKALYRKSCSNDDITIDSWVEQWKKQVEENAKNFDFNANSVMQVHSKEEYKPIILAGSGPSLKKNAHKLNKHKVIKPDGSGYEIGGGREEIRIVSCLHNFGFFEDNNIMTENDYYLNLDAGDITIPEVFEGGKEKEEEYWARTKDRTLVAVIQSHPELLKKWQGRILFFHVPSQDAINVHYEKFMDFTKVPAFSVGGNALGACFYFAKAILGAGVTIFIGADFCFSYEQKFHAWNSPYDEKFSGVEPRIDIFGNRVFTWPSYFNFKCWFDYVAMGGNGGNPQLFINATEGGILGAYPEGNIKQIIQLDLYNALRIFTNQKRLSKILEKKQRMVLF